MTKALERLLDEMIAAKVEEAVAPLRPELARLALAPPTGWRRSARPPLAWA